MPAKLTEEKTGFSRPLRRRPRKKVWPPRSGGRKRFGKGLVTMLCNIVTVASLGVLLLSGIGFSVTKPPKQDREQRMDMPRRPLGENIMG